MKFIVSMKDPDTLYDAIRDAVRRDVEAMNLPKDEATAIFDVRADKAQQVCSRWFEHGEYLRVEVDTEAKTCTVLETK